MRNFAVDHLPVVDGVVTVPSGGGEAFVDADDISAIAAETLPDPETHADAIGFVGHPDTGYLHECREQACATRPLRRPRSGHPHGQAQRPGRRRRAGCLAHSLSDKHPPSRVRGDATE
ncbi:hypothetical protein ACIRYZ_23735 [Kitasatospora sp. NPDC101155]|uniref:hypothetical protein n=1 Tax=Kitasatospora sp. NPDC101155 TaxID=3364097 RepID=UPI0037F69E76